MTRAKLVVVIAGCSFVLATQHTADAQWSLGRNAGVDSIAAVRAVEKFHAALEAGDSAAAAALLDTAAVVLESGDLETRSEYLRHHLPADIAFARAVHGSRDVRRVTVNANAAWVVSTSRTRGTFEGRPVDSEGAELMVLTRTPAGWRIAAIHWSSHRRRQQP